MWEAVLTKAGKIGIAKTKGRSKEESRKEIGEESRTKEKKTEEGENDRSKKGSGGMGNLG